MAPASEKIFKSSQHEENIFFEHYADIMGVGIVTGYGPDDRGVGVRVPVRLRLFSSPRRPDRLWGPPNLLSNGHRGLSIPEVRRPWREAHHSPTSAEVKKM
jgi:hypothetical protein